MAKADGYNFWLSVATLLIKKNGWKGKGFFIFNSRSIHNANVFQLFFVWRADLVTAVRSRYTFEKRLLQREGNSI